MTCCPKTLLMHVEQQLKRLGVVIAGQTSCGAHKVARTAVARDGQGKLALAISGGVDSMALVSILQRLVQPSQLCAVIVDHQLRPESAQEAQQVCVNVCLCIGTHVECTHHLFSLLPL